MRHELGQVVATSLIDSHRIGHCLYFHSHIKLTEVSLFFMHLFLLLDSEVRMNKVSYSSFYTHLLTVGAPYMLLKELVTQVQDV